MDTPSTNSKPWRSNRPRGSKLSPRAMPCSINRWTPSGQLPRQQAPADASPKYTTTSPTATGQRVAGLAPRRRVPSLGAGCLPPHLRHIPCRHVPEPAGAAAGDGPPGYRTAPLAVYGTSRQEKSGIVLERSQMASCGRPRLRLGYAGLFPEYGFVVPFCPIWEKYGAYPKMAQTCLNPEWHIRAVCRVTTQPTFAQL